MNTKFVLASVFAAVSGFAGLANTASAGPDIRVNIDLGRRPGPVIVAPRYAPVPVVPVYGHGHDRRPDYRDDHRHSAPRGYWKDVAVKVWVPAEWVVTRDRHGHAVRSLRPGYFTYRNDRVWVADVGPHGGHFHGHGRG